MEVQKVLEPKSGGVLCCSFSPSGAYVLDGTQSRQIHVWNSETGKLVATLDGGHGLGVRDLQCSSDSSAILSCGEDKLLLAWDVERCVPVRKIRAHEAPINGVRYYHPETTEMKRKGAGGGGGSFFFDSCVVVTGGADRKVHCWDLRSRSSTPLCTMSEARDGISSVDVRDHCVLSASLDGSVRQYDLKAGKIFTDCLSGRAPGDGAARDGPDLNATPVMGAYYSHDGHCIAAISLDSTVRLLDRTTGHLLNRFKGHQNERFKTMCATSHDDALIAAGSEDGAVVVWDLVQASKPLAVMHQHAHVVSCVSFSPIDAKLLLTGSIDQKLVLWKVHT